MTDEFDVSSFSYDDEDTVLGRPIYYDRAGNPTTHQGWIELMTEARSLGEAGYMEWKRVEAENVDDLEGREHFVSTVWLGMDHALAFEGRPLIFETMVFCHHEGECRWSNWQDRYTAEVEAMAGHVFVVEAVRTGNPQAE